MAILRLLDDGFADGRAGAAHTVERNAFDFCQLLGKLQHRIGFGLCAFLKLAGVIGNHGARAVDQGAEIGHDEQGRHLSALLLCELYASAQCCFRELGAVGGDQYVLEHFSLLAHRCALLARVEFLEQIFPLRKGEGNARVR